MITVRPVWQVLLKCPTFHMKEFLKVYVGFVVVAFLHMGQRLPMISVPATKSPQRYKWPPRSVLLKWFKKKKKTPPFTIVEVKKVLWRSCESESEAAQSCPTLWDFPGKSTGVGCHVWPCNSSKILRHFYIKKFLMTSCPTLQTSGREDTLI